MPDENAPPGQDRVCVLVPDDFEVGKSILHWALQKVDKNSQSLVILVHVNGCNKQTDLNEVKKKIDEYDAIRKEMEVMGDVLAIKDDDVEILWKYIGLKDITNLVVGVEANKAYSKRIIDVTMLKPNHSGSLLQIVERYECYRKLQDENLKGITLRKSKLNLQKITLRGRSPKQNAKVMEIKAEESHLKTQIKNMKAVLKFMKRMTWATMHILQELDITAVNEAGGLDENNGVQDDDDTPNRFLCPISGLVMERPCFAADGYTYDYNKIMRLFLRRPKGSVTVKSPMTNLDLENLKLIPNYLLKSEIEEWKLKNKQQMTQVRSLLCDPHPVQISEGHPIIVTSEEAESQPPDTGLLLPPASNNAHTTSIIAPPNASDDPPTGIRRRHVTNGRH